MSRIIRQAVKKNVISRELAEKQKRQRDDIIFMKKSSFIDECRKLKLESIIKRFSIVIKRKYPFDSAFKIKNGCYENCENESPMFILFNNLDEKNLEHLDFVEKLEKSNLLFELCKVKPYFNAIDYTIKNGKYEIAKVLMRVNSSYTSLCFTVNLPDFEYQKSNLFLKACDDFPDEMMILSPEYSVTQRHLKNKRVVETASLTYYISPMVCTTIDDEFEKNYGFFFDLLELTNKLTLRKYMFMSLNPMLDDYDNYTVLIREKNILLSEIRIFSILLNFISNPIETMSLLKKYMETYKTVKSKTELFQNHGDFMEREFIKKLCDKNSTIIYDFIDQVKYNHYLAATILIINTPFIYKNIKHEIKDEKNEIKMAKRYFKIISKLPMELVHKIMIKTAFPLKKNQIYIELEKEIIKHAFVKILNHVFASEKC